MFRSASDDLERKNQDLLEAQAEGVLLREQLLRCEAELALETGRRQESEQEALIQMQLRYCAENGGSGGFQAADWKRMSDELSRSKRQHLECRALVQDLTHGRLDSAMAMHRAAGGLHMHIPFYKRDCIHEWICSAERDMRNFERYERRERYAARSSRW